MKELWGVRFKKKHIIYKNIQYITANIECWAFASPVTRIKCWHFPFLHVSYLSKYQHIMHRIMFGLHVHELTFLSGGGNNGIGGGVTYCIAKIAARRETTVRDKSLLPFSPDKT